MKKLHNILSAVLLGLLAIGFTACDDDDVVDRKALMSPSGDAIDATVSSLTFQWEKDGHAVQYGYKLIDPTGKAVAGGVTAGSKITFNGLKDDTEYTLELTPFAAALSDTYQNGPTIKLTGRTAKILPLASPEPTYEVSGLRVTVTWDEVDNADTYYVRVLSEGEEVMADTIETNTYRFNGTKGSEYSVEISADTDEEAYSQSEWARIDGIITDEEAYLIWTVTGTYYDAAEYLASNSRTMEAYSDGSYIIKDWLYSGSGCDLEFSWDAANKKFNILNGTDAGDGWYTVEYYPGGYTSYVAADDEDNVFDAETGHMAIYAYGYGGEGQSTFDWDPASIKYAPLYSTTATMVDVEDDYVSTYPPQCDGVEVDVYKDFVYVRNIMGVKGYDLKVEYDENDIDDEGYYGVSRLTSFKDGAQVTTGTSGYVTANTGYSSMSYLNFYVASGYCRIWLDNEGGYLELGCYLPSGSWSCYGLEWNRPSAE